MMASPTTSMKKGWLCRNSCDEKNHEISLVVLIQIEWWSRSRDSALVMIQIEWWSRSKDDSPEMIQIEWRWSRSSDDLDSVMMIQIEWWSRSSDNDPDWVMMIQINSWSRSRWRWLEDEDDKNLMMIQMIQRRRIVLLNCVERIPS